MSCKQFYSKVGPYVDGELPFSDRDEVENHLRQCSDCREMTTAFRSLDRLAGSGPAPRVTNEEWSAVLENVKKREPGLRVVSSRRQRWKWLAPVGALAALLALAFFVAPSLFLTPPGEAPEARPLVSPSRDDTPTDRIADLDLEDYVEIIDDGTDPEALREIDIQIIDEAEDVEGTPHLRYSDF